MTRLIKGPIRNTCLYLGLGAALCVFGAIPAAADGPCAGQIAMKKYAAADSENPGRFDPLRNPRSYNLYSDDEVMVFAGQGDDTQPQISRISSVKLTAKGSLTNWTQGTPQPRTKTLLRGGRDFQPFDAAAGRVRQDDKDDVVVGFYEWQTDSTERVKVAFRGEDGVAIGSPTAKPSNRFVSVAVGDLDRKVDDAGSFHDDVVVVFGGGESGRGPTLTLAVLDRTLKPVWTNQIPGAYLGALVDVGDLDADGAAEIAVLTISAAADKAIKVLAWKYENDAFVAKPTIDITTKADTPGLVVTDMNGDGRDEAVVGYSTTTASSKGTRSVVNVLALGYDNGMNPSKKATGKAENLSIESRYRSFPLGTAAGVFKFDPEHGYTLDRHQVVVAVTERQEPSNPAHLFMFDSNRDLTQISMVNSRAFGSVQSNPVRNPRVGAGNFLGFDDKAKVPRNDLVAGIEHYAGASMYAFQVGDFDIKQGTRTEVNVGAAQRAVTGVIPVPYDSDGDSVYLGAPAHFVIEDVLDTDFVIQEPPKHVDYLNGKIVNLTRKKDFNIALVDEQKKEFDSKSTETSSWTIGGSAAASAKYTVGQKAVVADAEFQYGGKIKVEYAYDRNSEEYNKNYQGQTVRWVGVTDSDDYLVYNAKRIDIWRYRVYGISPTKESHGFYEVVMPGREVRKNAQGGRSVEWFQPIHQNGNALSYPTYERTYEPPDLGQYRLAGSAKWRHEPFSVDANIGLGPSQEFHLQYREGSETGTRFEYEHSLSESLDLHYGYKSKVEFGGHYQCWDVEVDVNFSNSNSWGGAAVENNQTSSTRSITLRMPSFTTQKEYDFAPVFYATTDGTVKATHAVALLAGPSPSWWRDTYKGADPALNLPLTYSSPDGGDTWEFTPDDIPEHNKIRGFFVTDKDPNPVTGEYDVLSSNPVEDDVVRLRTRVYNYSIGSRASGISVDFSGVEVNPATGDEIGDPRPIGKTTTAVDPQGHRFAEVLWNTAGWGPSQGNIARYRIYVTLDGAGQIEETHELGSAADNNRGWYPAAVQRKTSAGAAFAAEVSLGGDAVAVRDAAGTLQSQGVVVAELGRMSRIRVRVDSSMDSDSHRIIYISEKDPGAPAEAARVVAAAIVRGLDSARGSYVWVPWLPRTSGQREIVAEVLEWSDDPRPGNAADTLTVEVR